MPQARQISARVGTLPESAILRLQPFRACTLCVEVSRHPSPHDAAKGTGGPIMRRAPNLRTQTHPHVARKT